MAIGLVLRTWEMFVCQETTSQLLRKTYRYILAKLSGLCSIDFGSFSFVVDKAPLCVPGGGSVAPGGSVGPGGRTMLVRLAVPG